MLYRKMPHTGDELSVLGFGAMRLPVNKDWTIDQDRAIAQIRGAIDGGVNYVDTAWPYHSRQSEGLVGLALADGWRDKVHLATKLPSWLMESRADMDRYLDAQLAKLKTDKIDYYLLHALEGHSWDKLVSLEVADFLEKAMADGRIGAPGFSFHGPLADFKRIVDGYPFTFCQIQYNYLDRQNQAGEEGLKYAAAKGLGVVIMEPLRGGNLSRAEQAPAIAEIWASAPVKRSPAEWALRWVWNHPEVTVVLSGMNEEDHIAENLAIAAQAEPDSLSPAELEVVDRVAAKYRELMKVGCTGCGYCMPCPSGVYIPQLFEIYNTMALSGNRDAALWSYAARGSGLITSGEPGYASQCVECGECLEKCPQHLEVPDFLAEVAEEFEGPDLEKALETVRDFFMKETA